jgi:predicted metal-dependent phosphoesterase TrpH
MNSRALPLAAILALAVTAHVAAQGADQPLRWFKGNTHAHTLNSDGDVTPDALVTWYREQRYQFLVITDHNVVTPVEGLNAIHAAEQRFLVIRGEEVTDKSVEKAGEKTIEKPVHLNLLGGTGTVAPQGGETPAAVLQRDIDAMQKAGGLIQINHPNFGWALSAKDLEGARGAQLIEVYNGHPQVNNIGGGGLPGAEALWDAMLTSGQQVFAVATDDTHDVKRPGVREAGAPGRGWIVVRARQLTPDDVLDAMRRGDFYASTGVELADVQATARSLAVTIKAQSFARYTVQFIGSGGRVLKVATSSPARYDFTGEEGYVRAKVIDSMGYAAWTQAVRVKQ